MPQLIAINGVPVASITAMSSIAKRRKPRAFLQYRWREDLLPNEHYRRIWQQLVAQFNPDTACRLMVESLYIAAVQDQEYVVALWLEQQLRTQTLTLLRLQQHFHSPPTKTALDTSMVAQHPLSSYDQLLHHQISERSNCRLTDAIEITAPVLHATAVAGVRKTGTRAGMDLRTVSPSFM